MIRGFVTTHPEQQLRGEKKPSGNKGKSETERVRSIMKETLGITCYVINTAQPLWKSHLSFELIHSTAQSQI